MDELIKNNLRDHQWINGWTHTHIQTMEYYLVMEGRKEILPLVTTWVNLEGIMLRELYQREKDKYYIRGIYFRTYFWNKQKIGWWLPEAERSGRNGYQPPSYKMNSSGALMHSMVTIANHTALYTWKLLQVLTTQKIMKR